MFTEKCIWLPENSRESWKQLEACKVDQTKLRQLEYTMANGCCLPFSQVTWEPELESHDSVVVM